jgi:uncharacterized protein (TIGR00255 family)
MIRSMTGFGRGTGKFNNSSIAIELKSVNSKQFDLNLKCPPAYNDLEPEIRTFLNQHLERGKIYCSIVTEQDEDGQEVSFNMPLILSGHRKLLETERLLGLNPSSDYLSLLLRIPDAMRGTRTETKPDELDVVRNCLETAVREMNRFREKEGQELENDFLSRIKRIEELLLAVTPYEEQRISRIRERITRELNSLSAQLLDMNRFEQEMIYYIEKIDITEEKVRLQHHLDYFREVMKGEEGNGRKLNFIAQEMGREINTLGSKANDSTIQRMVVEMKDELEKIKEQLLNIL